MARCTLPDFSRKECTIAMIMKETIVAHSVAA